MVIFQRNSMFVLGEWRQDITSLNPPFTGLPLTLQELLDEKARKWQSLNAKRYGEKRKPGTSALGLNGPLIRESHAVNVWLGAGNSNIYLFSPLIIGEMIQIWRSHFSRWVGEKPTNYYEDWRIFFHQTTWKLVFGRLGPRGSVLWSSKRKKCHLESKRFQNWGFNPCHVYIYIY